MKRTAIDHPKVKKLARLLGIQHAHAVGIVECLWHFTARHAIIGDIGRWTDDEIAEGAHWEGDATAFVTALIDARLADASETYRVVIHDWHEHCDEYVKKVVKNKGLVFASIPDNFQNIPEDSRKGSPKPYVTVASSRASSPAVGKPDGSGFLREADDATIRDTQKLIDWHKRASQGDAPLVPPGERGRLVTVAFAERAIEHGKNPVAFFVDLVKRGVTDWVTGPQEDRARERIAALSRDGPRRKRPGEPRHVADVAREVSPAP